MATSTQLSVLRSHRAIFTNMIKLKENWEDYNKSNQVSKTELNLWGVQFYLLCPFHNQDLFSGMFVISLQDTLENLPGSKTSSGASLLSTTCLCAGQPSTDQQLGPIFSCKYFPKSRNCGKFSFAYILYLQSERGQPEHVKTVWETKVGGGGEIRGNKVTGGPGSQIRFLHRVPRPHWETPLCIQLHEIPSPWKREKSEEEKSTRVAKIFL